MEPKESPGQSDDHEKSEHLSPKQITVNVTANLSQSVQLNGAVPEQSKTDQAAKQTSKFKADEQRRKRILLVVGGVGVVIVGVVILAVISVYNKFGPAVKAELAADQGWTLFGTRNFQSAEAKFKESIEADENSVKGWNGLGWCHLQLGRSSQAIEAFNRCLEIDDSYAAALNGLGQIYLSRREYDKAEEYLSRATLGAPAAWYGLCRIYMLQGKYQKAYEAAEMVANQQNVNPVIDKVLAEAKARQLSDELRKLIEPPDPSMMQNQSSWKLLNSGDLDGAQKQFEMVLKENPDDAEANNGLGFCLLNSGKPKIARTHFEKCLDKQPDHLGAMNGLARCFKADGEIDKAVELWEKMQKVVPGINVGTIELAGIYLERKEYAKAVAYYEKLVEANPNQSQFKASLEEARAGLNK